MNKFNVAVFFAAMLIVGACAAPRKMLISSGTQEMADAAEHQRILQELETIQALRDRMLAEGLWGNLEGVRKSLVRDQTAAVLITWLAPHASARPYQEAAQD
ncbi:MAG: hypothetical protein FRX49_09019 [Trebouxia sp. A1-2]|nr:MAG: hypothetical protein FRX49_09019 [Trebouxia sp. A1-2]